MFPLQLTRCFPASILPGSFPQGKQGQPAATPGRVHQEPPPANPPGDLVGHYQGKRMRIFTVFQFGAWQGCVLNLRGRVVYQSLCYDTEYQARGDASRWLLSQQGRAA